MYKPLSPNDQLAQMSTYTLLLLCFPLPEEISHQDVVSVLKTAIQKITDAVPYLGGEVAVEKDFDDRAAFGTTRLAYPRKDAEAILQVRNVHNEMPTYRELGAAKVPFKSIPGALLTSALGFPDQYDLCNEPKSVLAIQANFISGGLLLSIAGLHNVMDGTGLGEVIWLLAAACRGDDLPEHRLEAANLDRSHLISPTQPYERAVDLQHLHLQPQAKQEKPSPSNSESMTWACFRLSNAKLAELKIEASKECLMGGETPWITTNDAASALIWKAISSARLPRLDGTAESLIVRTVSGRRRLTPPLPDSYPGNVVHGARGRLSVEELATHLSVSDIAIRLRKATNEIDDLYVRSQSQLFRSEPDKRKIGFVMETPGQDLMLSSLADLPIASSDFGPLLGRPEFVRRPDLTTADGLVYLLPKDAQGNLDVAVSLRCDDLEELKKDEMWSKYAEFIG